MATPHLTQADVKALWARTLAGERRRELVRHFLRGCDQCSTLAGSLVPPAHPTPEAIDRAYEFALRRAAVFAKAYVEKLGAAYDQARNEVAGTVPFAEEASSLVVWERAKAWLARAESYRHRDTRRARECAALAWGTAAKLTPEGFAPGVLSGLFADIWAELGNAHRVAGDLDLAERAFAEAALCLTREEEHPLRIARHADLVASYFLDARCFTLADEIYGRLANFYRGVGNAHAAGRVLILRAQVQGKLQDFAAATEYLLEAVDLLDHDREPKLVLFAYHALIDYRAQAGRYDIAKRLLLTAEPLYELYGDVMDRIKGRWVEGKIELGLRNFPAAEQALREVHQAYVNRGLPYQAALVTLDLARLWLLTNQLAELKSQVAAALETLRALKIRPDALAAVILLHEALDQERATLALIRRAAEALEGRG